MRRAHPATPESSALRRFVGAVQALSQDPAPLNVERYLFASRALEESVSASGPVGQRQLDQERRARALRAVQMHRPSDRLDAISQPDQS